SINISSFCVFCQPATSDSYTLSLHDALPILELTEGMRFDKGMTSMYFVTDSDRMEAVLEDPYILIVNSKISANKDLLPLLDKVVDRKSTRLNSSHVKISYAVFCLKKKNITNG